jgi:hypothetical protein
MLPTFLRSSEYGVVGNVLAKSAQTFRSSWYQCCFVFRIFRVQISIRIPSLLQENIRILLQTTPPALPSISLPMLVIDMVAK